MHLSCIGVVIGHWLTAVERQSWGSQGRVQHVKFLFKKCIINNTTRKFQVPHLGIYNLKVTIVQMMALIIYVLNTVSHRPLDNSPTSHDASVKFPPFLILRFFESLCLPLFTGFWMLGATARKKGFGNHCWPYHSVSL